MIRKCIFFGIFFTAILQMVATADARRARKGMRPDNIRIEVETPSVLDLDLPPEHQSMKATAQADTFVLGYWTFDWGGGCVEEGWTTHDRTAQPGAFFHVDDFAGLGGGSYGYLEPLEGNQSAWCGARPDAASPALCGYAALPGYGNDWDQSFCFKCVEVPDTEKIYIDYLVSWNSESGWDYTYLEYATKGTCDSLSNLDYLRPEDWVQLESFTDTGTKQLRTDTIPAGLAGFVTVRFRFDSDGGWSDEDGLYDTDGAIIVDSITVRSETATYDFEDFEDESPGDIATTDGDWEYRAQSDYGDYAALFPGVTQVQEDPCKFDFSCLWTFINGSMETYACGGFPGQLAVPKENERGQYIWNEIWSPPVALTGSGSTVELAFDVYRDVPLKNLVFYKRRIRQWIGACPGRWSSTASYYGSAKDWLRQVVSVGVEPGASHIQVALGVHDRCDDWCGVYGDGACHSHAPLFDNIEIRRIDEAAAVGPRWSPGWVIDTRFQDTFPTDGTSTGTGRVDACISLLPYENPNILPADSIAFTCEDPSVGLKEPDPYTGFGSAVYLYVSVHPQNQLGKMGHAIEGDNFRWPVVDSVTVCGEKWYMVRMDTVFIEEAGPRTSPVADHWCIDLNDNLFTAGDTLYFFCGAENASGIRKYWSKLTGNVLDINEACASPMEMQILPGAGPARGGDILYVNAFGPRGGEPYFNTAFQIMGIFDQVDRFDIRAPSSGLGNRPGYHVRNVYQQLHPNYRKIIWNSGDLPNFTICDGINGKGQDFLMLFSYLDQHPDPSGAGVYISGDNVAEEWNTLSSMSALNFRDVYMPHSLINANHVPYHGISPFVIGEPGSMFDHGMPFGPDTIVAYGGCPVINNFDVISPFGDATLEMTYGGTGQPTDGAVLSYDTLNALGNPAGVVLSGFSFHFIRDDVPSGVPDRVDHMTDIIRWIGNILDDPSGAGGTPQFTNSLAQNYPNPFNPSTTIKYSIRERAHVSLKIYNVAGQLVKTLVNEEKPAGEYTKGWTGRSDAGDPVSSGVYFYKLVTKHFTRTKKMVMLK